MALRFQQKTDETYDYQLTIGHLLDSAMTTAADHEIIYRDQLRMTYRDLRARIGKLASLLQKAGGKEGMTIAVMDWDSHRYLESYFAIPMMGAVLQTVNIRLATQQILYTLNHAETEIILVHHDFFPIIEEIRAHLPNVKAYIAITDGTDIPAPEWAIGEYEALSLEAEENFPFREFDENAMATIFYTTGTTGYPKGVAFSHRQIVLHTLTAKGPLGSSANHRFGLGYDDVYMPLTPMFHVHAWGIPFVATLLGVKQVYPGRYQSDLLLDLKEKEKVSFSHCVPTILQMVLAEAKKQERDLTGWHIIIGGSALTTTLYKQARNFGIDAYSGYGMSETCPLVCAAHRKPYGEESEESEIARLCTTGVLMPLVSLRVVDENMVDQPFDGKSQGEMVLRAPWLSPSYVKDPARSKDMWRGGWMHTQDVVTVDTEGVIVIRDRIKDVIKTGGEWVSSLVLENKLNAINGINDIAVIGIADERWGERPIAIIVSDEPEKITTELLNTHLKKDIEQGRLSRYATIDRIEFLCELPKTSVGKIDKKELRKRFDSALPV